MIEIARRAGTGAVSFARARGAQNTHVRRAIANSPLKLLTPKNRGHAAWVFGSNHGGGLVAGDALSLAVRVEEGATAFMGTQASTKVYRNEVACGASQAVEGYVASDALLVVLPDPLVCFADASYRQRLAFTLEASASLVLLDTLGAGRTAHGERWGFRRYDSCITIDSVASAPSAERISRRLLTDGMLLDPVHGELALRIGRFDALCTLLLIGPRLRAAADRLHAAIGTEPMSPDADVVESVSRFGAIGLGGRSAHEGLLLRAAATSVEALGRRLRARLEFIAELLGDDPFARKW